MAGRRGGQSHEQGHRVKHGGASPILSSLSELCSQTSTLHTLPRLPGWVGLKSPWVRALKCLDWRLTESPPSKREGAEGLFIHGQAG